MQRTIKRPVSACGIGLHTGYEVKIELHPAPANTGIVFRRIDLQAFEIEAVRTWVSRVVLATTLMKRGVMLSTVEHLLSAVYGYGIDNLYVDIDSMEVPILDGSALPFVELLEEAQVEDQPEERTFLVIDRLIRLEDGDKFISIEPNSSFRISYEIDFAHPSIGCQSLDFQLTSASYRREVAFARTFGFYDEVEELRKKGLIQGGTLENAVVLDAEGVMNGSLRAPDEFVRHKVLDLIGDISLCGYPIIGHIRAYKAGHALHTNLATEIWKRRLSATLLKESDLELLQSAVNQ
jgi:UDP-3-O-[3-hydroxymyristoyl] N-acetylglucosamine deacetylase